MTTTVARIYQSYGAALEVSAALKGKGFRRDEIDVISKAVNKDESQVADLMTQISRAGIPAANVAAYVAAVDAGKSLLVVRAAWGSAKQALKTVSEHAADPDALDEDFYESSSKMPTPSTAADVGRFPLSSYFKWPLLLNEPAPFSKYFNFPVLLPHDWTFSSFFSWPLLTSGYSFGEPKLINNSAILSEKLNMPVLSRSDTQK